MVRSFSVERLDGCLLIHAEHRRMAGRVQVQPDHVGRFGFEVGVVGDHVPLQPVRTNVVLPPDALHGHEGQSELGCQLAAAPMGRAVLGLALQGVVQHPCFQTSQITTRRSTERHARLAAMKGDETAKDARIAVYRSPLSAGRVGGARSRPRRLDDNQSAAMLAADEALFIVSHASGVVMPPRLGSNRFDRTIDEHDHP
jgi:hypothetical protein